MFSAIRNQANPAFIGAIVASVVLGTSAYAANVHLKGGRNAEPSFQDGGLTLRAMGSLSGLGNGDVLVTLAAEANVDATCGNPGGNQHQAPGQNPAPVSVSGSQAIPEEEIKNGTTPFDVVTIAPPTEIVGAPDCPNSSWTELVNDLLFTSATITVEQPAGTTVLVLECSISPPSTNGAVNRNDVTCF